MLLWDSAPFPPNYTLPDVCSQSETFQHFCEICWCHNAQAILHKMRELGIPIDVRLHVFNLFSGSHASGDPLYIQEAGPPP